MEWDTGSGIGWGKADIPRELGGGKEAAWPEQWMRRKLSFYENINDNPGNTNGILTVWLREAAHSFSNAGFWTW